MGQEDPLEYERETHSSILAWKIPQTEGTRWLQSMELRKVRNDLVNEHVHNGIDKEMERERECMGVWVCRNMCEKGNFSSVQFSRSVVSDSLQPHESHHARPPCPSPTPGVHPDSRPSSQ